MSICLSLIGPGLRVEASTDLVPGGPAVIADANGDVVRLRTQPDGASSIVAEFPEGTVVDLLEGPLAGVDGSFWYRVSVQGLDGFIAADFLNDPNATPTPVPTENPTETPEATPTDVPTVEVTETATPDVTETPVDPTQTPVTPTPAPTETPTVETAEITGTGKIVNTGGDAINCRRDPNTTAEIIAFLTEGTSVDLRGALRGDWQPVLCDNKAGWVFKDYVRADSTPTPKPTKTATPVTGTAGTGTVVNTDGDGAICRAKGSSSGAVITTVSEGTVVTLRRAAKNGWQPVRCANRNGFIASQFVRVNSGGGGGGGNNGGSGIGNGTITGTNGDGVVCRTGASTSSTRITVLVEGDVVVLRRAAKNGWQPIRCANRNGYVKAEFVVADGGTGGGGGGGGGSNSNLVAGDTAKITGTNGEGVRIRSKASSTSSTVAVALENEIVDVRTGSTGDWVAVTYKSMQGFIHMDYLTKVVDDGGGGEPNDNLLAGDHAKITSNINFRSAPSKTASVIAVAPQGLVILITGATQNGFYPVDWAGTAGFMAKEYLVFTTDPLTISGDPIGGGDAGDGSTNATGQRMVAYAMNYLGFPYIWATAGPDSFDCSGFTYWVTLHVIGDDIGRGLWTQIVAGTPVTYGNLQPGDIVFFQNTYTWGLSHVGIYIGNNQFIHAENEETGVKVSSLTSQYYSTRWYGAVRLS